MHDESFETPCKHLRRLHDIKPLLATTHFNEEIEALLMESPFQVFDGVSPRQSTETTSEVVQQLTQKLKRKFNSAQTLEEITANRHNAISKADTNPENLGIEEKIGKKGLMWPRLYAKDHDTALLLNFYSTEGCPADCGDAWTQDIIEAAIRHCPHKSAQSADARAALRQETLSKIDQGFARKI